MDKLPSSILQNILDFAVPGYAQHLVPVKRTVTKEILKELQLVSKAWYDSLHVISQQYEKSALTLVFKSASNREIRKMHQVVKKRGNDVTELYVCMGTIADYLHTRNFILRPSLKGIVENVAVDWLRIFANLPNLKVLNLSEMPLGSIHVVAVLDAASTQCPKLESLSLPFSESDKIENVRTVLAKLYEALKRWRTEGKLGGLKRLRVPTRTGQDPFYSSQEFFANVMDNCPNVEYLDGYKMSLFTLNRLTCKDFWLLRLRDWEKFNATCTNLREFNWVVVPFGNPYFNVFGKHVKPQMKQLSFGVNMDWNWRWYFNNLDDDEISDDWDQQTHCERPGYGFLATDVSVALKGCPMLDELHIQLYHPEDANVVLDGVERYRGLPKFEVINANVFDDQFCKVLAANCPILSEFEITEITEQNNAKSLKTIQTFTDKGLLALSQLKFLQSLKLRSVNCTGEGIFEFLNSLSEEFVGNREFEICIGGNESTMSFYTVIKDLLLKFVETSDPPCKRRKFVLRVENCSCSSQNFVDGQWSSNYLDELDDLMTDVKNAHPSLRQLVVTMGGTGYSFKRIAEFGLHSVHADPTLYSAWEDWETEEENQGIEIVDRGDFDDIFDVESSDGYPSNHFSDVSDIYLSSSEWKSYYW
ncbi:hypothetical protein PHMEG_00011102 [Phytophthora megakarya]|uniref:F-box domain-containing protein n=1 Tax=Phytophthora megakarya TaxID=4795 RepID=A0A225WCD6_9STRA|nr:hypothetical protein PHMEG_00011102 [Phytophthora megakarya]